MLIPVVVPFRVCKYFFMMPFRFIGQLADKFVMIGLKKLNVSKYDAKTYATQVARKQVINIKYFVILMIVLGLVFSFALSVSTSVYTFMYLYLIPSQSQELLIYFNYVPVEKDQIAQFQQEAYLGQGIATFMQKIPTHKLIASAQFGN